MALLRECHFHLKKETQNAEQVLSIEYEEVVLLDFLVALFQVGLYVPGVVHLLIGCLDHALLSLETACKIRVFG